MCTSASDRRTVFEQGLNVLLVFCKCRAKEFYLALGFSINPLFTDHNAACVVIEEDRNALMILTREFFQTFTDLPLGDRR